MTWLLAELHQAWHIAAGVLTVFLAAIASGHVVLYKRDSRAAVAWVGLIWLVPVIGSLLYVLFGINRIRRRAALLRGGRVSVITREFPAAAPRHQSGGLPHELHGLASLAEMVGRVTGRPLTTGNAITPLSGGDQAYPAMIAAIDGAERTVALATFIFDHDAAGRRFQEALSAAVRRGVTVRVLIDDMGARYSFPSMVGSLRSHGMTVARFGTTLLPWRFPYANLRNHRKLLVVDGRTGFTGGMNIRDGHVLSSQPKHAVQDLHFRITGPVVAHLMQTFADDWLFTARERLAGDAWFPGLGPCGSVLARGIVDGPDEDFEKAEFVRLGALACAEQAVRIVTPYFVPDSGVITALTVASMRGVRVEIVLPAVNNQQLVHWASQAQLWQLVKRGCRMFYTPEPFDHTKLFLVDDRWSLIGSSNWDARSLRLNFEFEVECYDRQLAAALNALVDTKIATAREITAAELDARSLSTRLRDGVARLAAPYL